MEGTMADRFCKNCTSFELIEHEYGECRRYPPTVIEKLVGGNSHANIFQASKHPLVPANHWCGLFSPEEE
jgi:hypothetical protein